MKQKLPNLLIIAGTGRKSGKTTIACNLIHFYSKKHLVYAIKISPHKHFMGDEASIIIRTDHYKITEEFNAHTGKDSSRMLAAGAARSLYIECDDHFVKEAFLLSYHNFPSNVPVICESPALISFINPGLFIIADHPGVHPKKEKILAMKSQADFLINIRKETAHQYVDKIAIQNGSWHSV
ncbi:MAG: hypothetical protein KQI35_14010 [Bacteroidetes bacterium]|nr:hypothetical protein [Bacteroidota bacterium]